MPYWAVNGMLCVLLFGAGWGFFQYLACMDRFVQAGEE